MINHNFRVQPLQLLAEPNVNTTTDPGLSAENKTFYDLALIREAGPELIHDQFGQKRPIPKNGGRKIQFRKYASLPKALTPLTEGITPDGRKLSVTTVEAEVNQYGDYVCLSDVLDLTAIDSNALEATRVLPAAAAVPAGASFPRGRRPCGLFPPPGSAGHLPPGL